ncbi:resolvase [Bacillus thuringiensis]|uniref:Resolvase n=1 Tax=Bacillus thuringiensis TaxID=1428 RepID=A0ABD6S358_BACTU|nr:resolvase [Bacillus thuringiensis]PEU89529.1 resolvase [Bacillus thuringiensis]PFI05725.1 resolvase [Bacillus thuringiensis]PFW33988.1 resolvase [Bacillus thuringiensis]PGY69567.1 resolvase [Bacillus thuringiensis]
MKKSIKLHEEGNMTVKQICEITNVSRSALYRILPDKT